MLHGLLIIVQGCCIQVDNRDAQYEQVTPSVPFPPEVFKVTHFERIHSSTATATIASPVSEPLPAGCNCCPCFCPDTFCCRCSYSWRGDRQPSASQGLTLQQKFGCSADGLLVLPSPAPVVPSTRVKCVMKDASRFIASDSPPRNCAPAAALSLAQRCSVTLSKPSCSNDGSSPAGTLTCQNHRQGREDIVEKTDRCMSQMRPLFSSIRKQLARH